MINAWLVVSNNNARRPDIVIGCYDTFGKARMIRSRLGRKNYDIAKVASVEVVDMSKYDHHTER